VNCTVQFDWIIIDGYTAKEEVTTGAAAGTRDGEIQSMGMYVENHIGSRVSNCGIRMGPHVVEELVNSFLVFSVGADCCVAML
jgi:hypothetical protein